MGLSNKKSGDKPYKRTRQLVEIALNHPRDSMTQREIATLCSVSQPTVSKWASGEAKASVANILPLREKYGDYLSQASKHYCSIWPVTEGDELKGERLPPQEFKLYHYRVEGHVILSVTCGGPVEDKVYVGVNIVPKKKLVIHHQGGGVFRLVEQSRILETNESPGEDHPLSGLLSVPMYHSSWWMLEKIHQPLKAMELVTQLDDFAERWMQEGLDAFDLPMKVRKALCDNGFPVSDVKTYPAGELR